MIIVSTKVPHSGGDGPSKAITSVAVLAQDIKRKIVFVYFHGSGAWEIRKLVTCVRNAPVTGHVGV